MILERSKIFRRLVISALTLSMGGIPSTYAEKADQDKPVILQTEKLSVNDVQQLYELDGEVLLTKGSILITGEKGHIKIDPEGYEYVNVQGTPELVASFRQRREGPTNEFIQGRGNVVTYNAKTELLTLIGDTSLKRLLNMQMLDQLHGWKIEYNDTKQYYRVSPPSGTEPDEWPLARAILSPRRKAIPER